MFWKYEKETTSQVFSREIYETFRNTYFEEHLPTISIIIIIVIWVYVFWVCNGFYHLTNFFPFGFNWLNYNWVTQSHGFHKTSALKKGFEWWTNYNIEKLKVIWDATENAKLHFFWCFCIWELQSKNGFLLYILISHWAVCW